VGIDPCDDRWRRARRRGAVRYGAGRGLDLGDRSVALVGVGGPCRDPHSRAPGRSVKQLWIWLDALLFASCDVRRTLRRRVDRYDDLVVLVEVLDHAPTLTCTMHGTSPKARQLSMVPGGSYT
jgi:hypothetical protein